MFIEIFDFVSDKEVEKRGGVLRIGFNCLAEGINHETLYCGILSKF